MIDDISAAAGVGIAQIGSQLVEPRIADGSLVLLLKPFMPRARGVYLTRRYTQQGTKALIAFIATELSRDGGKVP